MITRPATVPSSTLRYPSIPALIPRSDDFVGRTPYSQVCGRPPGRPSPLRRPTQRQKASQLVACALLLCGPLTPVPQTPASKLTPFPPGDLLVRVHSRHGGRAGRCLHDGSFSRQAQPVRYGRVLVWTPLPRPLRRGRSKIRRLRSTVYGCSAWTRMPRENRVAGPVPARRQAIGERFGCRIHGKSRPPTPNIAAWPGTAVASTSRQNGRIARFELNLSRFFTPRQCG